ETSTEAISEGTPRSANVVVSSPVGEETRDWSATTVASKATATSAAAATTTAGARTGLVDGQTPTIDVLAVELFDGTASILIGHFDESEPSGPAGLTVG